MESNIAPSTDCGGCMTEISERIASNVILENERFRVWEDGAAPGETEQMYVPQGLVARR